MSPVMDCQLVKVETCLSHSVLWDLLQPSVTLHRMSRYRNWMDGCLLFFVWRGSVTQLSATGIGTGRLKGNSLFYQSSQTSHNNPTSQLAWTCHISFDVCLSDWGRTPPPPQSKKQDMYFSRQATLNNTKFQQMFAVQWKESCKCCLQSYANHSSQRDPATKQKEKKDAYK